MVRLWSGEDRSKLIDKMIFHTFSNIRGKFDGAECFDSTSSTNWISGMHGKNWDRFSWHGSLGPISGAEGGRQ